MTHKPQTPQPACTSSSLSTDIDREPIIVWLTLLARVENVVVRARFTLSDQMWTVPLRSGVFYNMEGSEYKLQEIGFCQLFSRDLGQITSLP